MSLYSYDKNNDFNSKTSENIAIAELGWDTPKKVTLSSLIADLYRGIKNAASSSRIASIIIPSIFIFAGVLFIYRQIYPEIQQSIALQKGYLDQGTISPVSEEYIDFAQFISTPESFADLTEKALEENILAEDNLSSQFSGTFYITIQSLGINRLPVTANVDSTNEQNYLPILNNSLAHFKSTGLPISNVENNIVIYGHSISQAYSPSPSNPMVAFSLLHNLKVGDEIIIEIDSRTYKFRMQKSKIVSPTDVSILTGTKGKRTLTLFTCYPAGNNAQRYVAIARPVD